MRNRHYIAMIAMLAGSALVSASCTTEVGPGPSSDGSSAASGKSDSGWISNTSYEVDTVVRSVVAHEASGVWAGLRSDEDIQAALVDSQIAYLKYGADKAGYRSNQLVDKLTIQHVSVDGDLVTVAYEAVVDMVGVLSGDLPTLEELEHRVFDAPLPLDPINISARVGDGCASDPSVVGSSYGDAKYSYYFEPRQAGCTIELVDAKVEVTEVFPQPTVFPEYDQIMFQNEDGTIGFFAAIVPARGDRDPASRFDAHREMFENDLGLRGERSADGESMRFEYRRGEIKIVIDLFDPTVVRYSESFHEALSKYELVLYNGHSNYGTKDLVSNQTAYAANKYQILMLHSCQSYAYYVQQAIRAKRSETDPDGTATVDFVATGRSSYPKGSPKTLHVLMEGLMDGIHAILNGQAERATSWNSINAQMNRVEPGILYGVAAVRSNAWQPN